MCSGRAPLFLLATWLLLSLALAEKQSAAQAAKLATSATSSLQTFESNHVVDEAQSATDISNSKSSSNSDSDNNSKLALVHAMFKRGAPRFLGKRQRAPRFLGKRSYAPRFLGKRQKAPRLLGKRTYAPRFLGKRQKAPRLLGKRSYAPRFLGKRQKAPRLLGKRSYAPRFLGKRQKAPRLLGKRAERFSVFPGEMISELNMAELLAPALTYQNTDDEEHLIAALGKREVKTPYVNAEEFIKTYRKSDPYFMGKRGDWLVEEDGYHDNLLDDDFEPEKRGAPRFLGKRGAPRFLGKRGAPRFLGKRGAPRFLGKRGAPRFLGKRGAPRFLGKRGAPRFLDNSDALMPDFEDNFEKYDPDSITDDTRAGWLSNTLGDDTERLEFKGPYLGKVLDHQGSEFVEEELADRVGGQIQR